MSHRKLNSFISFSKALIIKHNSESFLCLAFFENPVLTSIYMSDFSVILRYYLGYFHVGHFFPICIYILTLALESGGQIMLKG